VTSAGHALGLIDAASAARRTRGTAANAKSSRSHLVVTLQLVRSHVFISAGSAFRLLRLTHLRLTVSRCACQVSAAR
jgi:hypothetical protein